MCRRVHSASRVQIECTNSAQESSTANRVHKSASVEPDSYDEAVASSERGEWRKAMSDEVVALKANETWTLVDRPPKRNVIPGKWVFKVKLAADGSLDKYKARYVAKGFKQLEGLEYHETFAPTCKPETLRLILALAPQRGVHLHQMDVKSAYLHSTIEEEVYLEQPEGFQEGRNKVCRLNKSIYGLKQAARNWYDSLAIFLKELGFTRSVNDYCLFVRAEEDQSYTHVLTWVDDIILSCPSNSVSEELRSAFCAKFKMDDRGELSWFLGIRVLRTA